MTYVNIFLVCSSEALHDEAEKLQAFIRSLNDDNIKHGLYFMLNICEDEGSAKVAAEKQIDDDQSIKDSQLFIIIFYKYAGEYALKKFDVAYKYFKNSLENLPAILTFFRTDGSEATDAEKALMERLNDEFQHYYKPYPNIESLEIYFLMQIRKMGLDTTIEFRTQDMKAYVGGEAILSLEYLPEVAENAGWHTLSEKCDKIEKDLEAARRNRDMHPENDNYKIQVSELGEKHRTAKRELYECKEKLLELVSKAVDEFTKEDLDECKTKVFQYLAEGKNEAALEEINMEESFDELDYYQRIKDSETALMDEKIKCLIETELLNIDVLTIAVEQPNRFKKIEEIYERIVKSELQNDLEPTGMRQYVIYLTKQNKYKRGIEIARQYEKKVCDIGNLPLIAEAKGMLALLLGYQVFDSVSQREAENLYCEEIEILQDLDKGDSSTYKKQLALAYNDFAGVLSHHIDEENQKTAEEFFQRALNIFDKLSKENPAAVEDEMASCMANLSHLLCERENADDLEKAEELACRSLEIRSRQGEDRPDLYEPQYALACETLGCLLSHHSDKDSHRRAEALLRKALEIRQSWAMENPEAFEYAFAVCCVDLADLLCKSHDEKSQIEAEKLYVEALNIFRGMDESLPTVKRELAVTCNNLACLYRRYPDPQNWNNAKELYNEGLSTLRSLSQEELAACKITLASICDGLGSFLIYRDEEKAEELLLEALEIKRTLTEKNSAVYEGDLAITCGNLGGLYSRRKDEGSKRKAEALFRETLEILRRLVMEDPSSWGDKLATSCGGLANILLLRGDKKSVQEAEKLTYEGLDILYKLVQENPVVYEKNLAEYCFFLAKPLSHCPYEDLHKEAEELAYESVSLYRKLAKENPEAYDNLFTVSSEFLASLLWQHGDTESRREAEKVYSEGMGFTVQDLKSNSDMYELFLMSMKKGN